MQKLILILTATIFTHVFVDAQNRITGVIVGDSSKPISFASVYLFNIAGKISFCEKVIKGFMQEFGKKVKLQFDIKYRPIQDEIFNFMQKNIDDENFKDRNKKLIALNLPIENLSSYIHMSMNRWFITEQRLQEYMCYDFSLRSYKRLLHYNP